MSTQTMVRIYTTESAHKLEPVLSFLHDEAKVRGVTVLRGVSGFGKSGKMHESHIVDLSFDLPLVVEFFDDTEKVQSALSKLESYISPDHVVTWSVQSNL